MFKKGFSVPLFLLLGVMQSAMATESSGRRASFDCMVGAVKGAWGVSASTGNIARASPEAVSQATAAVGKQVFGARTPTPDEQAFVANAVAKGLAGPIDRPDGTSIRQLHDAVNMLEANDADAKIANHTASEIVSNLTPRDLTTAQIQLTSRAVLAGADFGIKDPKRFAAVLSQWPDGVNGLSVTLERAADLERQPGLLAIADPKKRQIAAFNQALDQERNMDPRFARGVSDKEWPEQRDHLRQCGIGF